MNITITGRHITISNNQQEYAEKKINKLETYFNQLIDARVVLSVEKLDHIAEVIINGDGVQFHGREKAADLFSAIDLLFEKMERQIVRYKEKHQSHRGPGKSENISIDFVSEEGPALVLNQVSNKPINEIEAYLQMKIDDNDFILFKKGVKKIDSDINFSNKNYALMYRESDVVKMVEVPFDEKQQKMEPESVSFVAYTLNVKDDSLSNPKISFKKNKSCSIPQLTFNDAVKELENSKVPFLPFYNSDTRYLNVIYFNGEKYEIMVPAF